MTQRSGASTAFPPTPERVAAAPRALRLTAAVDPLSVATLPGLHHPAVVTVGGWRIVVADPVATITDIGSLDRLAHAWGWRTPTDPHLPPFTGGAVGYLAHELGRGWLHLPADERPGPAPVGSLWFGVHDGALCVPPDGGPPVVVGHDEATLERWSRRAAAASRQAAPRVTPASAPARLSLDRDSHRRAVRRTKEWIGRGDLYQLNLTLHASVDWDGGGGALTRRLWSASPGAAHAAYLSVPGAEIVSVSPEAGLVVQGDTVSVRPIKGTRPRGSDPAADAAAAAALRSSRKDAAEHVMIVDLERNDLGRVCHPGSVEVPALAALEAHPTVWHLTSTVRGRLRDDVTLSGLLAATFPSGSVTGAPKRMAVARTAVLEPLQRGVYCGAIGVVTRGLVDLSVAIRTAVVAGGRASYGTGGGIVADSDPDDEFTEAMDKAAAFFTATGVARPR